MPAPSLDPEGDYLHHRSYESTLQRIKCGEIEVWAVPLPISQQLKVWSKAHDGSLDPSRAQVKALVPQLLGAKECGGPGLMR